MRKQVELDLGTPALNPTVQRAGQYRVAVQQTPKTNSALQLAQALRVTPQILGQANNIAKDLGAEAAAEVLDVEAAMDNDETRGILGYDKAYQQGLVKRHFAMNEEAIKERFMNLARTEDALKQTPEEFLGAMAGERKQFVDELMEQFGGNENREQALTALSGAFVDELRDAATAEFVQNKKDQALMMVSADTQTLFNNQGVSAGLDYMASEMSAIGVDLKPSERAQHMRDAVTSNVAVAIEQGQFSKAQNIINDAEAYGIKGAGKLFGSTKGTDDMRKVKASLRKAVEADEVSMDDRIKNIERLSDTTFTAMLNPNMSFENKAKAMVQTLVGAGIPDADASAKVSQTFNEGMTPNEMFQSWAALVTEVGIDGSDASKTLLGSIQDDFLRVTKDGLFAKPQLGITTEEQYDKANEAMLEFMLTNPTASLRDIPLGANVPKSDARVQEMFVAHSNAVKWRNDETSQYLPTLKVFSSELLKENGIKYAGLFETALSSAAQAEWDSSGRDLATFNTSIVAKAEDIKKEVLEEAKMDKMYESRLMDNITTPQRRIDTIKQAIEENEDKWFDGVDGIPYPMMASATPLTPENTGQTQESLNKALIAERGRILQDANSSVLAKGSLLMYGFPTLESYDETLRATARIGFRDFGLGQEVVNSLGLATVGWDAPTPTPEQAEAIKFWRSQGYTSSTQLEDILRAQASFRLLKY
jgi:hypothetical protein